MPKITLVTRRTTAVVPGHVLPGPGADMVIAWPTAEIAVIGASRPGQRHLPEEIKAAANPVAKRAEIIDNYETLLYNPYIAASRGFVDQVITPRRRGRASSRPYNPEHQAGNVAGQSTATFRFSRSQSVGRGRDSFSSFFLKTNSSWLFSLTH